MADQESVTLELDPRSVLAAVKQANQAVEGWEKQTIGSGEKMQKALERMSDMLLKMNDRSRSSMERLTQSIEKQAAAYGKTAIDRMIAERDRLIKKLGDEQGMIDRVTAAYAKMIDIESGKSGGSFQALGRNIEEFIKNPLNGSKDAATELAAKLGTTGVAVGVGAGVLAAFAVAGWEAAKSLGEYGTQIENTATRMGLTTREVGQFSFAAKVAGQDISVFEGGMRKLSQGLSDVGEEGHKTRQAFRELGIESRNADGSARPMSDVFLQISERMNAIQEPAKRNTEAIRLFGRSGIEALPSIMGLAENLKRAKELGLGASEEEVKRWEQYHKTITEADAVWDRLVRKIKEPIAATVIVTYKAVAGADSAGVHGFVPPGLTEGMMGPDEYSLYHRRGLYAPGASAIPGLSASMLREGLAQSGASRTLRAQLDSGLEGAKYRLSDLKTAYDDARNEAASLAANAMVLPNVAKKAWDEVEKTRIAYQAQSDLVKELEKDESRRLSLLEKARDLVRTGHTFYQIGTGPLVTLTTDEQMWQANQPVRGVPSLRRRGESNPTLDVAAVQAQERALSGLQPGLQVVPGEGMVLVAGPSSANPGAQEQAAAYAKGQLGLIETNRQARLAQIATQGSLAARLAELDRQNQIQTARTVGGIREDTLRREFEITGDIVKYRQESVQNELEMRLKIAEEEKHQLDSLRHETAGLLHTLFTRPSDFGKQLRDTIRDAALKPIEEGIGGMIAAGIHPLICGAKGEGGLSGVFHGLFGGKQQDPLSLAMDMNREAEENNTAAMVNLTEAFFAFARLPRMASGGITNGPTIAGEAGPEMVIPLHPVLRGPDPPDIALMYRGVGGMLRENNPRMFAAWEWIKNKANQVWNDPGLAMLPGPMAMEIEGEQIVAAVTKAGRAARRPTGAWEKGEVLWNKSIEETRKIGAKGGRAAWANKTPEQWADWEDRVAYESTYHGPEPGPRETTHEAAAKMDDQFPWLKDAFKKTEASIRRQQMSSAAGKAKLTATGPRIVRNLEAGQFKWAIDTDGRVRLAPNGLPSDSSYL